MSLESAFEPIEALYKAQVMYETWGHLYPTPTRSYTGFIEWNSDDCSIACIKFAGLSDNPETHEDVFNFIFDTCCNGGKYERKVSRSGIYRWTGTYKKCKNGTAQFTGGKLELRYEFRSEKT